jgi:hypothetical protein
MTKRNERVTPGWRETIRVMFIGLFLQRRINRNEKEVYK